MSNYKIFETEQFQKDIHKLIKSGKSEIEEKLNRFVYSQLRQHPHFGPNIRKLRDFKPETWRYRIRDWRFFYEIDEKEHIVFMIAASHRGSAY